MQRLVFLFDIRRQDLLVMLPRIVATPVDGLTDDDPWVVVAEDAGILLVTLRIRTDLTVFDIVMRESGVVEHDAMLTLHAFLHRVERFVAQSFLQADAGHGAPALTLDEDLAFAVLVTTNLVTVEVVGAKEPVTIPAEFLHGLTHVVDCLVHALSLCGLSEMTAEGGIVASRDDEQSGDHQALSLRALTVVLRGLEALVRIPGEAVEVQTVVPVGTPDERQAVWAEVVEDMIEGDGKMFEERLLRAFLIVKRHHLVEDRVVARLLDISDRSEDEPARVVVESAADIVVAALRQRLVLVVTAAVGELCRSDVDDTLARPLGDEVDEADEILVGVAEAHTTADATLEERGGTTHAERHHALVLVPDIHHTVELVVARLSAEDAKEAGPITVQLGKSFVHLLHSVVSIDDGVCLLFVDDVVETVLATVVTVLVNPFTVLLFLDIAEDEDKVAVLTRLERDVYLMDGDRAPAVRHGVAAVTLSHGVGHALLRIETDEGLAVGVEALDRTVDMIESVMVTTLPVFGLMVDRRPLDLHLSRGEVALEVLHIRGSVPQAPLLEREHRQMLLLLTVIREGHTLHLAVGMERHEEEDRKPRRRPCCP